MLEKSKLPLKRLDDWEIPITALHIRGRCEPTRGCGRCELNGISDSLEKGTLEMLAKEKGRPRIVTSDP